MFFNIFFAGTTITLSIILFMVKRKWSAVNQRLARENENRAKVAALIKVMLSDQKRILDTDPQFHLKLVSEIPEYIGDYLIDDLVAGNCTEGKHRYADAWVKKRYWEQMAIFRNGQDLPYSPWV